MQQPHPALDNRVAHETLERIRNADRIVIGAGAGLSIDAGINYGSREHFARRFPAMAQRGYSCELEVLHFEAPDPALTWGYLADHIYSVRWETPVGEVYRQLLELVKDKDYFVITSNVDGQFLRAGFEAERLYAPQGEYAILQCYRPCTDQVWPSKPIIDAILPTIDRKLQTITNRSVIPSCPHCGGPVFMNVRGGPWFVEKHLDGQRKRFSDFIQASTDGSLVLLELGAGFNTPSVIRWPFENIAYRHPDAHLVRINPAHPEVPEEIGDQATVITSGALAFTKALALAAKGG